MLCRHQPVSKKRSRPVRIRASDPSHDEYLPRALRMKRTGAWAMESGALYTDAKYPRAQLRSVHCGKWWRYESCDAGYLSLIHISEPTRLGMISYAVFCL